MTDFVGMLVGIRGSGKSTLAQRIAERWSRVIIFDPRCEYADSIVCVGFEQLASFFESSTLASFRVSFRTPLDFYTNTDLEYEYAARLVWEIKDCLVVLEEVETYLSSYDRFSAINFLISQGRHRNISILGIGRRPWEIPIKLRGVVTDICSFHQSEPTALSYLGGWGFDAEELMTLALHDYIRIEHGVKHASQNSLEWE